MIVGVHHLGIVVRSIADALPLYESAFGLRRVGDWDNGLCVLAGPNVYVVLYQQAGPGPGSRAGPGPVHRPGIRHFCVQNHDCSQLEQAVYAAGGDLIAPPLDLGTGNQYAYARDREGNIIEIEGLPYAPVAQPSWIGHIAIVTRDMDASLALFSALLGVPSSARKTVGPGPQYDRMGGLSDARLEGAWLPAGNMLLEFWQFHAPAYDGRAGRDDPREPGFAHLALETDDMDGDGQRLRRLGCNPADDAVLLPGVRSSSWRTADGIVLSLVQSSASTVSLSALSDLAVCTRIESRK